MNNLIQLSVSGLAMGFIYCLVAVEYTLIWNATGLINFAHERFIVLGAFFFGGTMMQLLPGSFVLGIACTMIFMMLYGILVAILIINPLRNMPSTIFAVMGMLMVGYIMREGLRLIWGARPFTVKGFLSGVFRFGNGIVLSRVYVFIIVISVALLIAQKIFMTKTMTGKAVRCVAQDKETAALMGVNVKQNIAITVGLSSVICGLVGMLVIPIFSVDHSMASMIALKGFASGVVGGFGTFSGAIVGGLTIGLLENLYLTFGDPIYKDVVAFVLLIFFLMIKPTGIMGQSLENGKRSALHRLKYRFTQDRTRKGGIGQ